MNKRRRAAMAVRFLLYAAVKAVCGAVLFRKRFTDIWLFSERGYDACDNAWALFRYLRERYPEKKAYYILDRNAVCREEVEEAGRILKKGSLRHAFYYFLPTAKISTHIFGASPDTALFASRAGKRFLRAPGISVFLQHGVTKDDIPALYAENTSVDLFVCGAAPEYEFVKSRFGYPEGAVRYLGFARYDALHAAVPGRAILFMPTWRAELSALSPADFAKTGYFLAIRCVLSNKGLSALLEKENVRLVFASHPEMRKFSHLFHISGDRISVCMEDIGAAVRACAALITDFSSVMFDFAYRERPVVYLAMEGLLLPNYPAGYFDRERDGFGPLARNEVELLQILEDMIRSDFQMGAEYKARATGFFPLRDGYNCARNVEAIADCIAKTKRLW